MRRLSPRVLLNSVHRCTCANTRAFHASRVLGEQKRNLYDVLGVDRGADKKEVKTNYFKLAKKLHPDTNKDDPDAAKKFAEATAAYEVLMDDDQRARYDQHGHEGVDPNFQGGTDNPFAGASGFEDIFSQFFGGGMGGMGGQRRQPQKGSDKEVRVVIDFAEAAHGAQKNVTVLVDHLCQTCDGSGADPDVGIKDCPCCGGAGQIIAEHGFMRMAQTCPSCRGRGAIIEKACGSCDGGGTVVDRSEVAVEIPEGVDSGMRLRIEGKGHKEFKNAPAGDLYVHLAVKPDPFFKRVHSDIHTEVPISMADAALGATLTTLSLSGEVEVEVPAGTQNNSRLVLRGKGVRMLKGGGDGHGDHYIKLVVDIPTTPTPRQKDILREFQQEEDAKVGKTQSLFKKRTADAAQRVKDAVQQRARDAPGH